MTDEYYTWNHTALGISFMISAGRITIFKTTLAALDYPEYYRFMFNSSKHEVGSLYLSHMWLEYTAFL